MADKATEVIFCQQLLLRLFVGQAEWEPAQPRGDFLKGKRAKKVKGQKNG
jgi:hypothetical protein